MGVGQMTIPLFLSTIPAGVTFTVDEISRDTPEGFWTHITMPNAVSAFPHTFQSSDIAKGLPNNKRGAHIADLALRTAGVGLKGGQGGSFLVKFTIGGRPDEYPNVKAQSVQGTLTIGTSAWGFFSRPDQTEFAWQIGNQHRTYTAKTPVLSYLEDACMAIAFLPDEKKYVFGVTNQQDFFAKIMQNGVSGLLAGHEVLWSVAAGLVASIGGFAFGVVAFGASYVDGV